MTGEAPISESGRSASGIERIMSEIAAWKEKWLERACATKSHMEQCEASEDESDAPEDDDVKCVLPLKMCGAWKWPISEACPAMNSARKTSRPTGPARCCKKVF